jgi:hypothetical protein
MENQALFDELKNMMLEYEGGLEKKSDTSENYYLDSKQINPKNKKPIFFGAVQVRKKDISYHLMPVYIFPELLSDMSDGLKKRMQGKSCFNFKKVDPDLFHELKQLTDRGFEKYKEHQLL